MIDTPPHIYQIQYDIIAAKSMEERVRLAFETIDITREWIENSIKQSTPNISEIDLAIAVFLRYYQNDFSKLQIAQIIKSMRAYHKVRANKSRSTEVRWPNCHANAVPPNQIKIIQYWRGHQLPQNRVSGTNLIDFFFLSGTSHPNFSESNVNR